jgi:hypothetical protein
VEREESGQFVNWILSELTRFVYYDWGGINYTQRLANVAVETNFEDLSSGIIC